MPEHCKEDDSTVLVPGEKECYDGAITCGEIGRTVRELTTRGNLDLRKEGRQQRQIEQRIYHKH
jgi:hypothetical protein